VKKLVTVGQGGYYLLTGLWPLLSMSTFEAVSGPKVDDWLVRTVGVLVTVIGLVLLAAVIKNDITAPVHVLAIGSAGRLAFIDFYYAMRGVIWPVYILDGVAEILLIGLWTIAIFRERGHIPTGGRRPLTN
jgi:hydrogenase/urease accessory protein HupE